VIRRGARERQSQRDVYRAAERRDLDCRHPDIVVWRDHRVEFAAHRPDENRIRGERPLDSRSTRGRSQQLLVFAAESPTVTRVRIERAQRDSWRCDSKPALEPIARDAGRFHDGFRAQSLGDAAKRDVSGREHHAKLVRGEHHRHAGPGQAPEHFRVTGKIVATGVKRGFVDGSGDDSFHGSRLRHLHGSHNCESAELARERSARFGQPAANGFGHLHSGAFGTNDHNVTALADPWVGERFGYDLRTNSAGIAHGHGKARFHCYIRRDT